ncbi:unnamed protein product [Caenorhabditis auriculariae]|uniref:Uncharacterized protein n=1 Tax=Caenorhabditis auriculariae TaxID=2777116 RepID=A0A8S1H9Y2_9PELO|nr:unnamed protein product [Caenorhabditis auriculariae]
MTQFEKSYSFQIDLSRKSRSSRGDGVEFLHKLHAELEKRHWMMSPKNETSKDKENGTGKHQSKSKKHDRKAGKSAVKEKNKTEKELKSKEKREKEPKEKELKEKRSCKTLSSLSKTDVKIQGSKDKLKTANLKDKSKHPHAISPSGLVAKKNSATSSTPNPNPAITAGAAAAPTAPSTAAPKSAIPTNSAATVTPTGATALKTTPSQTPVTTANTTSTAPGTTPTSTTPTTTTTTDGKPSPGKKAADNRMSIEEGKSGKKKTDGKGKKEKSADSKDLKISPAPVAKLAVPEDKTFASKKPTEEKEKEQQNEGSMSEMPSVPAPPSKAAKMEDGYEDFGPGAV